MRSSAPVGHVSVKLCDVAPDGTSTLITRGMLDLAQRGVWPSDPFGEVGAAPQPVVPGEWMDLKLQFEATTWTLLPGHRLRLAIAGTDWPNCWPPSQPFTLGVRRGSVRLVLWTAKSLPAARDLFDARPRVRATATPTVSSGATRTTCWHARPACTPATAAPTPAPTAR